MATLEISIPKIKDLKDFLYLVFQNGDLSRVQRNVAAKWLETTVGDLIDETLYDTLVRHVAGNVVMSYELTKSTIMMHCQPNDVRAENNMQELLFDLLMQPAKRSSISHKCLCDDIVGGWYDTMPFMVAENKSDAIIMAAFASVMMMHDNKMTFQFMSYDDIKVTCELHREDFICTSADQTEDKLTLEVDTI